MDINYKEAVTIDLLQGFVLLMLCY